MKKNFCKFLTYISLLSLVITGCDSGPVGPQGEPGKDGISVVSIELLSSVGLLDTYQINYSDGSHDTFTVTNGADGESIKGEPGEDGHTPVITVGSNGNWYVDNVDTGIKAQGPQGPIGPAGPQGPAGENGIDGKDGTSLLTGSGAPNENLGKVGDSYIDIATWDFYIKDDQGWKINGNIKGSNGQDGKSIYDLYVEQFPGYVWGQEQFVIDYISNGLVLEISFDTLGGLPIDSIVCYKGQLVNINQIASRDHGTFAGWFYDLDLSDEIEYSFIAKKSECFYAKYKFDEISVTFMDSGSIYEIVDTNYYSTIIPPSINPKPSLGYKFIGWRRLGDNELFDFSCPVEEGDVFESVYDFDCLELPVLSINTLSGEEIVSKEEYCSSLISISNTDEAFCFDDVSAGVRGRGNTTWGMPKKPYRIKFDKKVSLFGSDYKAKSWTLIANYTDKSLSRNYLALELSKLLPSINFTSLHVFVDLYLNNEYKGVYLLCDQIQVGEGRIDIGEDVDSSGDNGYLIEKDFRAPSEGIEDQDYFVLNGEYYAIKSPDTESEQFLANKETEVSYIKNFFNQCWRTIWLKNQYSWNDVISIVDVDSFADSYILDELFANVDVFASSCYFYKEKNGKLHKGPVWDYDISAGNCNYALGNEDECPSDSRLYAEAYWYKILLDRPEFKQMIQERLNNYKDIIYELLDLCNPAWSLSLYSSYNKSLLRNFDKWDIMGQYIWPEPKSVYDINTLYGQFDYLKNWLKSRYQYMYKQYLGTDLIFEEDAFKCVFNQNENVDSICVYKYSNNQDNYYVSNVAFSRDSETGLFLKDGNGQINFTIYLRPGAHFVSLDVEGGYKNIKLISSTENSITFRITKITSDLSVSVITE